MIGQFPHHQQFSMSLIIASHVFMRLQNNHLSLTGPQNAGLFFVNYLLGSNVLEICMLGCFFFYVSLKQHCYKIKIGMNSLLLANNAGGRVFNLPAFWGPKMRNFPIFCIF